jgi:hypothetical protein
VSDGFYRAVLPHYVCGFTVHDGLVAQPCAPIMRWAVGKPATRYARWAAGKGGTITRLEAT